MRATHSKNSETGSAQPPRPRPLPRQQRHMSQCGSANAQRQCRVPGWGRVDPFSSASSSSSSNSQAQQGLSKLVQIPGRPRRVPQPSPSVCAWGNTGVQTRGRPQERQPTCDLKNLASLGKRQEKKEKQGKCGPASAQPTTST